MATIMSAMEFAPKKESKRMVTQQLVILLAEDDEGHASLVQRNLKRAGIANDLIHVKDGQEALDFIQCQGAYATRVRNGPLLLLLDINMPRLDGVEVLRQVKADEKTAKIPVVMLTTTDDPREIQRCYELGCSVYVTKPVAYEEFVEAIKRLGLFLAIVRVPHESE
jgi:CheY-like chemotaxis protein